MRPRTPWHSHLSLKGHLLIVSFTKSWMNSVLLTTLGITSLIIKLSSNRNPIIYMDRHLTRNIKGRLFNPIGVINTTHTQHTMLYWHLLHYWGRKSLQRDSNCTLVLLRHTTVSVPVEWIFIGCWWHDLIIHYYLFLFLMCSFLIEIHLSSV